MSALLLKPSGSTGEVVSVTQERAGWQTISLRLLRIEKSRKQVVSQPSEELALVMLAGQATVRAGEQKWEYLGGRANVSQACRTLYLPSVLNAWKSRP
jgi:5-deoxy-glucuronate isomerase